MASGYNLWSSNGADNSELMMNSQEDQSNQYHHPIAPMEQSDEPEPSYPNAVVIAVSPTTLLDGSRFVCQVCYKGFSREQNLTLHRRVHNLPFHLKRSPKDAGPRKVYLCPEPTCINHNRSHALGDFGGLKKHYLRKHSTDKKHKCVTCYKSYAVASDLRAHLKKCSIKKYNCECGAGFSSHTKYTHHLELCDGEVPVDAAKDKPTSDIIKNSQKSITNNNITTSISSTTVPNLPSSHIGENSSRHISNLNNNSFTIGSTSSYIPVSTMGMKDNNISNQIPDSTMSHLPTFDMGHRSFQNISNNNSHAGFTTPNMYSVSSTQQNQDEFDENSGIGYYTNLMMNVEYNNVNPGNTSFMGYGSQYGSGQGSNLFSGPENMIGSSSRTNIGTSNMMQGFTDFSSGEFRGFEEQCLPFGTPNVYANMDIYGSTSRNSSYSNMVQPYARFGGGPIMPQEQNFVYGNENFGIPENGGFNDYMNPFQYPVTGSGVGSSFMNENVNSSYNQGNYYGYVDESRHVEYGAGLMNSGTFGATTGAVAPYDENYWNDFDPYR